MANSEELQEKLNEVQERLAEVQYTMILEKIDALRQEVGATFTNIQKMLDDHENRLRTQVEMDSQQGQSITELRVEVTALKGKVDTMELSVTNLMSEKVDRLDDLKWTLIKFSVVGVLMLALASGGTVLISKILTGLL